MTAVVATPGPVANPARFRGVLLGGGVGDALGAAVEFMDRTEILAWFGPQGIRDFAPVDGRCGTITDDTQLTLFCAEALLRAHASGAAHSDASAHRLERARSYLRWLMTQGETQPLLDERSSWLLTHPALFHRRGPGRTCLSSLRAMRELGQRAENVSKGCGGVMRVAPVGLFHSHWPADPDAFDRIVFAEGVADAALTHGHACGHLPAGYLALLIALLVSDVPLATALARCGQQLAAWPDHHETTRAIDRALHLANQSAPDAAALASLGHGWVGEEALAMALFCAVGCEVHGLAPETAVILAVNHDGDSDSTGAITGSVLGAIHGEQGLPQRWTDALELRDVLTTLADDLASVSDWEPGSTARLRHAAR